MKRRKPLAVQLVAIALFIALVASGVYYVASRDWTGTKSIPSNNTSPPVPTSGTTITSSSAAHSSNSSTGTNIGVAAATYPVGSPAFTATPVSCEGWACGLSDASIAGCGAKIIPAAHAATIGYSVFRSRDRATNESIYLESSVSDPRLCFRDKTKHTKFWGKHERYQNPTELVLHGSMCEIGAESGGLEKAKMRCDVETACKGVYGSSESGSFALTNAPPGTCALDWLPATRTSTDVCTSFFGKGFSTGSNGQCVPPTRDCPTGWEMRGGACRPVCDSASMGTVDGNSEQWCRWSVNNDETTWGCPPGFQYTKSGATEYCVPARSAIEASLFLSPLVAAPVAPERTDAECDGWVCGISNKSLIACRAMTPYTPDAAAKGNYNSVFRTRAGTFLSEAVDPRMCPKVQTTVRYKKKHTGNLYVLQDSQTSKGTACETDVFGTADQAERACAAAGAACAGYYYTDGQFTTTSSDPGQCRVDWQPIPSSRDSCTRFFGASYTDGARSTDACKAAPSTSDVACPLGWSRACTVCACDPPCARPISGGVCRVDANNACRAGLEVRSDRCEPTKRAIDSSRLLRPLVRQEPQF